MVLGHSNCGAVEVTIEDLLDLSESNSEYLEGIVSRIRPALKPLIEDHVKNDGSLKNRAVKANINASVRQLERGSEILARLVATEKLMIVGAEYSLDTGLVSFLD